MAEKTYARRVTRRAFIAAGGAVAIAGVALPNLKKGGVLDALRSSGAEELNAANDLFLRGEYASARAKYLNLVATGQISSTDGTHSAALCSLQSGDSAEACRALSNLKQPSADDWRLIAVANARSGRVSDAVSAFDRLPLEDSAFDLSLCEELAIASARAGDRTNSWRFYRTIEQANPSAPAIQRLTESGRFAFTRDFFGYDRHSILNYARGVKDGAYEWGSDALKSLWHLVRHPVGSVESFASGVAKIVSKENLNLLLSPMTLVSKLTATGARVYWSAWESCKNSAAREYQLNVNDFAAQQKIHEIAAGRMVGYVAPDLLLLVLSAGAGAAAKASNAEKVAELATATARAEQGIEKANLVGRSVNFLKDAEKLPALRQIAWLEERAWELIKNCPRLQGRLEQVTGWMSDIRHIPGAKAFVECMAARLHLADVEGNLFQLERAAAYAKKDELVAIGRRFYVDLVSPGKPVCRTLAEADLELKDGILVETKFRTTPLTLDEQFHKQLLKYDRAVAESQFKGIRLECNVPVTKAVRDRCSVLRSPLEIIDNVKREPFSAV